MRFKIIENWFEKKSTCHFCGTTKSVKYKVDIPNNSEYKEVDCCNKCVLSAKVQNLFNTTNNI